MKKIKHIIGRVPTVLVFNADASQRGTVTSIVVKRRRKYGRKRLLFSGKAGFDSKTAKHINKDILPLVDDLAARPDSTVKLPSISTRISCLW